MSETFSRLTAAEIDVESALDEDLYEKIDENQQAVYLRSSRGNAFAEWFGNGSDGASPTSATESRAYGNAGKQHNSAYTVDAGHTVTLTAGSYGIVRLGVRGTLTINGTITCTPGGGAYGDHNFPAGDDGSPVWAGSRAWFCATGGGGGANSSGNDGGTGGSTAIYSGGSPGTTGGASGSAGLNAVTPGGFMTDFAGRLLELFAPGTGGGGGAEGTSGHARGGTGGCIFIIEAETIVYGASSVINVLGEDGETASSNSGAGGGGGGGILILCARTHTDYGNLTANVTGGAGGGSGTGGDGGNGGDGIVVKVTLG